MDAEILYFSNMNRRKYIIMLIVEGINISSFNFQKNFIYDMLGVIEYQYILVTKSFLMGMYIEN